MDRHSHGSDFKPFRPAGRTADRCLLYCGIFALSIPATLIKGKAVAAASAFFVVVLSTSQIIFFTESANAMLESDIPVGFGDLGKNLLHPYHYLDPNGGADG